MKLRFVKRFGIAVVIVGAVQLILTDSAIASSSSWSYTMNRRYVAGRKNGRFHAIEAGNLTINGKVWIFDRRAGAATSPLPITIEVLKGDSDSNDNIICTVTVVPTATLNDKKEFSKSCGAVASDKYWIKVYKSGHGEDPDGWHSQGSGTLDITS